MALSADQLLLLNNMVYLNRNDPGWNKTPLTVRDLVENITPTTNDFQTAEQVEMARKAILEDPSLGNIQIAATHTDEQGGFSCVLVSEDSSGMKEAVVVNAGTSDNEWRDNFDGGYMTDTPIQERTLDWYQSSEVQGIVQGCDYTTVTGHSKGGNKAKYIAILDSSVDRCVSFDGEGFSDEFFEKYADQIAARQDVITNYAAESDFVNILLNDVGQRIYLPAEGTENNFGMNHSTFALLDPDNPSRSVTGREVPQNPALAQADQLLNSYLRTLPPDEKKATLKLLGNLVNGFMNDNEKMTIEQIIHLAASEGNPELAGKLIAYTLQYVLDNPDQSRELVGMLDLLCDGAGDIVNGILDLARNPIVKGLIDLFGGWKKGVFEFLIKNDISRELIIQLLIHLGLSEDIVRLILDSLGEVYKDMGHQDTTVSGDLEAGASGGAESIRISFTALENTLSSLKEAADQMRIMASECMKCASACEGNGIPKSVRSRSPVVTRFNLRTMLGGLPADEALRTLSSMMQQMAEETEGLCTCLNGCMTEFRESEERNTSAFGKIRTSFEANN